MSDIGEDISLLTALKDGKFEASLLTTFNATLPFYEEVVLRRLRASGSTENVVLMDAVQCARSWAAPSLRPRLAGSSYSLIPVQAPGAFHPKICLLASKKRCVLFIGSHNLTLSGFGFNREVTTQLDIRHDSPPAHKLVLRHVWSLIREWLRTQEEVLAPSVLETAFRIESFIPVVNGADSNFSDIRLLGQSIEGLSLLEQLERAVDEPPKRLIVTGAFFDTKHAFLRTLEELWPDADIKVIIDPTTVRLGARPKGLRAKFVNARSLWADKSERYLHAKALLLDFGDSYTLVAGSANPSGPAWLGVARRNFEAMLVRPNFILSSSTFASDLALGFSSRSMDEAELGAISITRQDDDNDSGDAGAPVRVAVLLAGATSVSIPELHCRGMFEVIMHMEDGTQTERVTFRRSSGDDAIIEVGPFASNIRWIELSGNTDRILRVIIHHEAAFTHNTTRSNKSALRDALANLDFSGVNIQSLIVDIEKAIFDDPDQVVLSRPCAGRYGSEPQKPDFSERPLSLATSIGEGASKRIRSRRRLLQEGSLLDVIDALFYCLGQGLTSRIRSNTDKEAISEEELVGNEDESAVEEPTVYPERSEVEVLRTRLKKIVARMSKQLKAAKEESELELRESKARIAVVRLVAVLSLIREFRRLRHLPQWRRMGGFIDSEIRQDLLYQAMTALYGHKRGIASLIKSADGEAEEPAELGQVRALLAWLAWDLGHSLLERIDPLAPKAAKEDLVRAYSYIYELLPSIVVDEEGMNHLASSIRMTIRPTADEGAKGEAWLAHHCMTGWEVATAPSDAYNDRDGLRAGDLMRIPHSDPSQLRVVVDATRDEVRLTDIDSDRRFERFAWKTEKAARQTRLI